MRTAWLPLQFLQTIETHSFFRSLLVLQSSRLFPAPLIIFLCLLHRFLQTLPTQLFCLPQTFLFFLDELPAPLFLLRCPLPQSLLQLFLLASLVLLLLPFARLLLLLHCLQVLECSISTLLWRCSCCALLSSIVHLLKYILVKDSSLSELIWCEIVVLRALLVVPARCFCSQQWCAIVVIEP